MKPGRTAALAFAIVLASCSGGSNASGDAASAAAPASMGRSGASAMDARFRIARGFYGSKIASVPGARELATLPDGDLLVGTSGNAIYIVPNADTAGEPKAATVFVTLSEGPAEGVAFAPDGSVYASTNTTIWKIPYRRGAARASGAAAIARVRTGSVAPNSDGDVHASTSVAATSKALYASVGSSCNACVEADPTRATVLKMSLDGKHAATYAARVRNAIAMTVDPATQALWIGGAGQDSLPYGHPYEYVDSPTSHTAPRLDYGWPQCEENHRAYNTLHVNAPPDCSAAIEPAIEFPAYSTLVGLAFYPVKNAGAYAFPQHYRGGLFVTSHGSWHCCPATPPRVYFVPMHGDEPATAVDWHDPKRQSTPFLDGLGGTAAAAYLARPTGVAIGSEGSLFVADDQNGAIYRIRPSGS